LLKLETSTLDRRLLLIQRVYIALAVALPLLSYPLALLPHELAAQRFDFRVPWPELSAVVLLLALLLERNRPLTLPHHGQAIILALFGFLFLQTISALLADTPGMQLGWILRAVSHLILALVATHFLQAPALTRIIAAWTVAAAVEALIVLGQHATGAETVGTIGNRNFAAGYLAISFPIGCAWLATIAQRQQRLSIRWLVWWLIAANYAGLLMVAMVAAESRGAILALALATACWGAMQLRPLARWIVGATACIAIVGFAFSPPVQHSVAKLWKSDVRPMIWLGTVRTIADAPLAGHGPDSFLRVYPAHRPPEYFDRPKAAVVTDHAHNEFLEIAAESGLFGLLAFFAVLAAGGRAARVAVRAAASKELRLLTWGVTVGVAALLLHNLVDINMRFAPNQTLFWIGLGWLGAAMGMARVEQRAPTEYRLRPFARLVAWPVLLFIFVFGVGRPIVSDWCFRQGILALHEGQAARDEELVEEAEDDLALVTRIDPDRVEAWRQLGMVAETLHHRELAVAAFRMAHKLAPDYANLNGELATLLALNGQYDEAATLLTRATRIQPRNATNYAWLGYVRLRLGQPGAARTALKEAFRLEPANQLAWDVSRDFEKLQPRKRSK
jgi:O-antigen ligase